MTYQITRLLMRWGRGLGSKENGTKADSTPTDIIDLSPKQSKLRRADSTDSRIIRGSRIPRKLLLLSINILTESIKKGSEKPKMTKNYYTIDKDQLIKDLEKIHYSTGAMEETKSLINEIGNLSPRSPLIIAVNLLKEIRDALNKRLGDDALIEIRSALLGYIQIYVLLPK
jgi:hypothetical protein